MLIKPEEIKFFQFLKNLVETKGLEHAIRLIMHIDEDTSEEDALKFIVYSCTVLEQDSAEPIDEDKMDHVTQIATKISTKNLTLNMN